MSILRITIAVLVGLMTLSTGCTYNVTPYSASAENVKKMSSLGVSKFQLSQAADSRGKESSNACRAAGPVSVSEKDGSYAGYIVNAFRSELKVADLLDESAVKQISIKVDKVDFDSAIGGGKWFIDLTLSNGANSITSSTTHDFESYFVADRACQAVAEAFPSAVKQAIDNVISDPNFPKLVSDSGVAVAN